MVVRQREREFRVKYILKDGSVVYKDKTGNSAITSSDSALDSSLRGTVEESDGVSIDTTTATTMATYAYSSIGVAFRNSTSNAIIKAANGAIINRVWVNGVTCNNVATNGYKITDKGTNYSDSSVGYTSHTNVNFHTFLIEPTNGDGTSTSIQIGTIRNIQRIMIETLE